MTGRDVNFNGILHSLAVKFAGLVSQPLVHEQMHALFCEMETRAVHRLHESVQGLWISLRNQVRLSGDTECIFWHFEHDNTSATEFHYIGEKAHISTADISKTQHNSLDG